MRNKASKKFAASGFNRSRLLLSIGLPVILAMAFLGMQFLDLDAIGWHRGFEHPLSGWDHLVTMLAVGIWAAQLRGQAIWMLPASFVGVMSLGGLAGASGLSLPSVEGIIVLSCAVFGVLITRRVRFGTKINVLIVAFFAFFHGFAHGQEISASASLISYTLGFMLATLLLHGTGILVAKLVVLAVGCLFSLMLSNVAIAAASNGSVLDGGAKIAAGDTVFASVGTRQNSYLSLPEHNRARSTGTLADNRAVSERQDSTGTAWQLPPPRFLAGWIGLARPQEPILSRLSFKRFFPDINQTPGIQLSSNGVGLTSPPLAIRHASAPRNVLNFHSVSIPNFEVPRLQTFFAKPAFGDTLKPAHITANADDTRPPVLLRLFSCATPIRRAFSDAQSRPAQPRRNSANTGFVRPHSKHFHNYYNNITQGETWNSHTR